MDSVKLICTLVLLTILNIGSVQLMPTPQDVQGFLGDLLKNYVTKNTRYYTLVNGVPVQESEDKPAGNGEILSRISSVLPPSIANAPVLTQILQQDANDFPNSWSPMLSHVPSQPSSNEPFVQLPYQQSQHQQSPDNRRYSDLYQLAMTQPESQIITVDDLLPQLASLQAPNEFKIQSTMSF